MLRRDDKLDAQISYVPELAEIWRGVSVPTDPVELERELNSAGIAPAARSAERKRTALPPKVRSLDRHRSLYDKLRWSAI